MFSRSSRLARSVCVKSYVTASRCLKQRQTHYDVLGLPRDCTAQDVKSAFIELSKQYHPDKNARGSSHRVFVRIVEAYSVLSKAESRRQYDWELAHCPSQPHTSARKPYRSRQHSSGYGYDESSFWANRSKHQERHYENADYYGISGIQRVSNGLIALMCVFVTMIGVALQVITIRHSVTLKRDAIKKQSDENKRLLDQLHEDSHKHDRDIQIQLMEQRFRDKQIFPRERAK